MNSKILSTSKSIVSPKIPTHKLASIKIKATSSPKIKVKTTKRQNPPHTSLYTKKTPSPKETLSIKSTIYLDVNNPKQVESLLRQQRGIPEMENATGPRFQEQSL